MESKNNNKDACIVAVAGFVGIVIVSIFTLVIMKAFGETYTAGFISDWQIIQSVTAILYIIFIVAMKRPIRYLGYVACVIELLAAIIFITMPSSILRLYLVPESELVLGSACCTQSGIIILLVGIASIAFKLAFGDIGLKTGLIIMIAATFLSVVLSVALISFGPVLVAACATINQPFATLMPILMILRDGTDQEGKSSMSYLEKYKKERKI